MREWPPLNPPRERFSHCKRATRRAAMLADATACARRCRVGIAIRFASASIIRCRSAHLVEVHLIIVYRGPHQCGERSNAAFGKQSAAEVTSLAPHDSKARLRVVTKRRDSWRSHVHRTRLRSACSSSRSRLPMCGVEGEGPSSFLLGD